MNQTLQNISCDAIRQNWNNHTECGILTNSPFYDIVWNDWETKYTEFTKYFYPILKNLVMGDNIGRIEPYEHQYYVIQENETTLILKRSGQ